MARLAVDADRTIIAERLGWRALDLPLSDPMAVVAVSDDAQDAILGFLEGPLLRCTHLTMAFPDPTLDAPPPDGDPRSPFVSRLTIALDLIAFMLEEAVRRDPSYRQKPGIARFASDPTSGWSMDSNLRRFMTATLGTTTRIDEDGAVEIRVAACAPAAARYRRLIARL